MPRPIAKRTVLILVSICLAGLLAACAPGIGNAIAIDKFEDSGEAATDEYVINIGDMLGIQVWEQASLSSTQPVRPDGRISMPLIAEIQAAGKTPTKLQAEIEAALKSIVINPRVTVAVQNPKLPTITLLGEVGKQGPMDLTPGMGVAQALAAAGGLSNFAHKDRIFVSRKTPKPVMILFTYDALLQGSGRAAEFKLRPGDTIIVR
jgi:polysaccharide export outer membrane protein